MLEGSDKDVCEAAPCEGSPSANPAAQLIFQTPKDFSQHIVTRQGDQVLGGLGKKFK